MYQKKILLAALTTILFVLLAFKLPTNALMFGNLAQNEANYATRR